MQDTTPQFPGSALHCAQSNANTGAQTMQNAKHKRALTIQEFADRWSIGRNSVYNAIARGELHSVKIGKRRVITLEQEERFRELMEKKFA